MFEFGESSQFDWTVHGELLNFSLRSTRYLVPVDPRSELVQPFGQIIKFAQSAGHFWQQSPDRFTQDRKTQKTKLSTKSQNTRTYDRAIRTGAIFTIKTFSCKTLPRACKKPKRPVDGRMGLLRFSFAVRVTNRSLLTNCSSIT